MPRDPSPPSQVSLWVDLPTPGSAASGGLVIYGWAFSRGGARIVEIQARLGRSSAVIAQGVHRPDVSLAKAEPHADWCGFEGTLEIEEVAREDAGRLVVRATDEFGESAEVEVPVRILPSGCRLIEVERARWSVDRVEVEGWLVWPESAPPRALTLFLGETRIGESTPNLSRPDVARRFPAFPHGSCRGFRLSVGLDPLAAPASGSAPLRIVCRDVAGRELQYTALLTRDSPGDPSGAIRDPIRQIEGALSLVRERIDREPVVLDWRAGLHPSPPGAAPTYFQPPDVDEPTLPYLDQSVDIVVTDGTAPERVAEARRVAAIATIEGSGLRWQTAASPRPAPPETSILFPVHEQAARTDARLAHLRETLSADFRGEILVLDDRSSDETSARLQRWPEAWPRVKILRSEGSAGFVRSLNRGAELARGEMLVFLGKESLPRPGWLPPLLRLFEEAPSVGAAGGKLLRPNGTLQAAGGILFSDGSAFGFGQGDGCPSRPLYSFVREVDYCSSAFLAVRRATFLELGGFDPQCGSPDYEGADFGLRLREKGYRVFYQPASVVVDGDAAASDTDPGAEGSGDPAESRERFRARWQAVLPAQPAPPANLDVASLYTLSTPAQKRRVLMCAPRMPEYDRDSGSLRVFHLVELMQQAGWAVSYLASRSVDGDRYLRLLQQRGVETYAGPDSVRAGDEYLDEVGELIANGRFDLAILAFWSLAEKLLPCFRSSSPATRVLVDSIDLHYLREERAALSGSPDRESSANVSRRVDRKRRELATYAGADAVLTVSTKEAEIVSEAISRAVPVFCVPDMEELARVSSGFRDRSGLLFIGNFHHPPNLEGLEFLCAEILRRVDPSLLAAFPLSVVGNGVNDEVRAAVAKIPHARVVGWVPSVVPYLAAARVSLVPLLHGAGTKRKLVQALMVGTPSVSTTIGIEGLELEHGRHVLIADSAADFAAEIGRLTTDLRLWSRLAREGRRHVQQAHGRISVQASLLAAVERTMSSRSPASAPNGSGSLARKP